ncbi:two-component sensor histidine kinase [Pseudodesulfovibrio sp. F-1]|uniref:histidine kinase n=1 Tax=Pseudodesulfovibrio alkaliphilus TaxID=2661613 RepID=A0A7K1KPF8_9BACT|nr:PAS domain-containing sensor histidine kinase [Pseudodesulfovibrio alkaliphilus]MUM77979.1 two-component sensor histidine kinase [Pseudodesulfovibrio alkaliphilus]
MDVQPYNKLSRNLALGVIAASLIPLVMVGALVFVQFSAIYTEKVYAHLGMVVDKHRESIDAFLSGKQYEVLYLDKAFTYEQLTNPAFLERTLKDIQQQYGRVFVDLGVIDASGRQIAYAGPFDQLGADYSSESWYVNSRDRKIAISDVFLGLHRAPHLIVTVNNADNLRTWTLKATIDFLAFGNQVENLRVGDTGHAYIVNASGQHQTRAPSAEAQELTMVSSRTVQRPHTSPGVLIERSQGSDGEEYIVVSAALTGVDWRLVFQQEVSDALSELVTAERMALLILVTGALAILGMSLFMFRRLVTRFRLIDLRTEMMNRQMIEAGKLASIGELAAGIAHEINNPVAIMIEEAGWVGDLLEDEGREMSCREEVERALAQIRTQGVRCKDITHKLLSFARQTDTRVTMVSLPELVTEVVNLSMQPARYARIEFSLNIDPHMPPIMASPTELQQVFLNLINNSIQAMEQDGGTLIISCHASAGEAFITVADTGPGIPEANLSRIFDPFFTTKPVGRGSGLGLSICYGIIHQMGGTIEAESTVGHGTSFNIRLPLQRPDTFQGGDS